MRTTNWPAIMAEIRPLFEAWGPAVSAVIYGIDRPLLHAAARRYGITYHGAKIGRSALGLPDRVALARAWLADGGSGGITGRAQVTRPSGHAAGVIIRQPKLPTDTPAHTPDTARYTRAPDFVDRRFAPEPGYQRVFSGTRPGVNPATGEAWA